MRTCDFDEAVNVLRSGQPLLFPTDTVVGFGVAVGYADGTASLSALKGRDEDKPIAWLVSSPDALDDYGQDIPVYASKLTSEFWPGALTLVVKASPSVPVGFRAADGTIGLRMPDDASTLRLIESVGCPIAATSANLSGHPAPCKMADVDSRLRVRAFESHDREIEPDSHAPSRSQKGLLGKSMVETSRSTSICPEALSERDTASESDPNMQAASTVIDCTSDAPHLLREGTIRYSEILRVAET